MNFWNFLDKTLDRLPGWPTERQWVTIGAFGLTAGLLNMAHEDPELWKVEVFKVVIQAVVLTGVLNMIFAFHFAANKSDETKSENTAKAFDAITATANAGSDATVMLKPGETAQAEERP
jgi:hypothetical protein